MDHARDWATRLVHESKMHGESSFLTLTYDDAHYPLDGSVAVRPLQLFLKKVRNTVGRVRFFACGEYGSLNWRAHFHVILFGSAFYPDRVPFAKTGSGHITYTSPTLQRLWPEGHSYIGHVTPASCGYVARYITKKVNGNLAADHYRRPNPVTGEIVDLKPEFICMSNRPGIGKGWWDQYNTDAFPSDFLIIEGKKVPVPRYYKKQLAKENPVKHDRVTWKRKAKSFDEERRYNNTVERLEVREELQQIRADRLIRSYEGNDT